MKTKLCRSGAEAIEAMKSRSFDLVLMDHMMPEMDGIEATRHIRDLGSRDGEIVDSYFLNVPIVALTANAVSGIDELFLTSGFSGVLFKPIDTIKLNSMLERWIPVFKQQPYVQAGTGSGNGAKANANTNTNTNSAQQENTPTQNNIAVFKDVRGLNAKKGLARALGDFTTYCMLLNIFVKDATKTIKDIRYNLAQGELQPCITYLPALKSACANVGAAALSSRAATLEAAGINKHWVNMQEGSEDFLRDLEKLQQEILDALEKETQNTPPVDPEVLRPLISCLLEMLDTNDSQRIDEAAEPLSPYTRDRVYGENISTILENVMFGEYDEARGIAEQLL
jgi:CheY-like chemotaxis protein